MTASWVGLIQWLIAGTCNLVGMFGFFFTEGPVNCFEDAEKADMAKFGRWHRGMLERGVYLAPSAYEVLKNTTYWLVIP